MALWVWSGYHSSNAAENPLHTKCAKTRKSSWGWSGNCLLYIPSFCASSQPWNVSKVIENTDVLEIEIKLRQQTVRIAVIYRPGHVNNDRGFLEKLDQYLESFLVKNGKHILCGDFNHWTDNSTAKPYTPEFLEIIDQNNLTNHIHQPTHMSGTH